MRTLGPSWPPVVFGSHGVPLRYTIHWSDRARTSSVEIHPDPNPFPRFRIWRWWR